MSGTVEAALQGPRAVAVVHRGQEVLVIKRHFNGTDYAVLPGGSVERGETFEEAAVRELWEESTLRARVERQLLSGEHNGREARYFLMTDVEGTPRLSGPELEAHAPDNSFELMWAGAEALNELGLHPGHLRTDLPLLLGLQREACRWLVLGKPGFLPARVRKLLRVDGEREIRRDVRKVALVTPPLLIVLAGLPGTGKTTIGRLLAGRLQAAYLRTDVIVGPMLRAGLTEDETGAARVGYDIACEVATENLRAGVPVVVDGVHATHERRALWRDVSVATEARLVQLETTLPDGVEHRLRVDSRQAPGVGYLGPTWEQILEMKYEAWSVATDGPRLLVDTSDTDAALAASLAHVTRSNPA